MVSFQQYTGGGGFFEFISSRLHGSRTSALNLKYEPGMGTVTIQSVITLLASGLRGQ